MGYAQLMSIGRATACCNICLSPSSSIAKEKTVFVRSTIGVFSPQAAIHSVALDHGGEEQPEDVSGIQRWTVQSHPQCVFRL